jgi:hypothetical protein
MATNQGSDALATRNPEMRARTGRRIAERRHQQVLEQLHQINVRLEAVTVALDRQSKLTAETNAKLDGVMKYLVENWKLPRQRAQPRR